MGGQVFFRDMFSKNVSKNILIFNIAKPGRGPHKNFGLWQEGGLVENFSPAGQDLHPQDVNYGTALISDVIKVAG